VPDAVGLELHGQTSLCGIATRAKTCKDHRFQDLYRMLDVDLLLQCWRELNKRSASGVDEVTAADYEQDLMGNIQTLAGRHKRSNTARSWCGVCTYPRTTARNDR
jgi:RNA-directed DNA polymerase